MTLKLIWDKFYVSIIFVLTCIVLGIILMCTVVGGGSDYSEVNVNEGDSLWALADQYAGKSDMAKADFVSWVEKKQSIRRSCGSRRFCCYPCTQNKVIKE